MDGRFSSAHAILISHEYYCGVVHLGIFHRGIDALFTRLQCGDAETRDSWLGLLVTEEGLLCCSVYSLQLSAFFTENQLRPAGVSLSRTRAGAVWRSHVLHYTVTDHHTMLYASGGVF